MAVYAPKVNIRYLLLVLEHFKVKTLGSQAFITGPGRYGEVEETQRTNSVKIVGRNSASLKGHDQTMKEVNQYRINEC